MRRYSFVGGELWNQSADYLLAAVIDLKVAIAGVEKLVLCRRLRRRGLAGRMRISKLGSGSHSKLHSPQEKSASPSDCLVIDLSIRLVRMSIGFGRLKIGAR